MHWLVVLMLALGPAASVRRAQSVAALNEGGKQLHNDDLDGAVKRFEAAVALDPTHARARVSLGQILRRRGDLEEAVEVLEALTSVAEDDPSAAADGAFQLGAARVQLAGRAEIEDAERTKHWQAAVKALDRAIALDDAQYRAHHRRALAHEATGDLEAADRDFRRCIEIQPYFTPCYADLSQLYLSRGFPGPAREVIEVALEIKDNDAGLHLQHGRLLTAEGKVPEAVDAFKKASVIDHEWPLARYELGLAYATLPVRHKAQDALEEFLGLAGPDTPEHQKHAAREVLKLLEDVI